MGILSAYTKMLKAQGSQPGASLLARFLVTQNVSFPRRDPQAGGLGGWSLSSLLDDRARQLSLQLLDLFSQDGDCFKQIAHNAVVGNIENGCLRIFVDGDDRSGVFHADEMLDGAGNT